MLSFSGRVHYREGKAVILKSAAVTFALSTDKHTVRKFCRTMFHSDRRSTVLGGKTQPGSGSSQVLCS